MSKPRCQCDPGCKETPLKDSPFCHMHQKCTRKSPLTGAEPAYDPAKYNKFKGMKEAQNCFAYAFNYKKLPKSCTKRKCSKAFPQPGRKSGYPKWSKVDGKRCPDLIARVIGDIPGVSLTNFTDACPKNKYKIALVTDEDQDYHFYRQDSNGYWSHKPGATDVIRTDATGRAIYDPALASRAYSSSGLDYDNFCGYMCVPSTRRITLKRSGGGGHPPSAASPLNPLLGRTLKRQVGRNSTLLGRNSFTYPRSGRTLKRRSQTPHKKRKTTTK